MLVLHHDQDFQELTIVYISSVIPTHPGTYDILIPLGSPSGIKAGLRENSVIIARWITVIKRIHVSGRLEKLMMISEHGLITSFLFVLPSEFEKSI